MQVILVSSCRSTVFLVSGAGADVGAMQYEAKSCTEAYKLENRQTIPVLHGLDNMMAEAEECHLKTSYSKQTERSW